jgi:hypothetical protein
MKRNTRIQYGVGLVAAFVVVIGAFGIGMASGQTTGDTFTGCLRVSGKIVKVAIGDAPTAPCVAPAEEISWGEIGPQGPPGQQGIQGIQGPPGVLGFYTRSVDIKVSLADDEETQGTANCDTGDVATGGGFRFFTNIVGSDAQATVLDNRPAGQDGWFVRVANFTGSSININPADVYVRCADVTP